jgi:hypothetical protein
MADEKYQDLAASRILLRPDDSSSTVNLGRVLGVGRTATVVEATLPATQYVDIVTLLAATAAYISTELLPSFHSLLFLLGILLWQRFLSHIIPSIAPSS